MKPEQDLRIVDGVAEKERDFFSDLEIFFSKGLDLNSSIVEVNKKYEFERRYRELNIEFVKIPGKNYSVMKTEVTQKLYETIMGTNPSEFKGNYNPVENVTWYDAVEFCNALSEYLGYESVYKRDGSSVEQNVNANGFRLPTVEEWQYAAKGGQNYDYSGSDNLDSVGWYSGNSEDTTHPVAQKRPNGYGLYDMSGNVWEWCWDFDDSWGNFLKNPRYNCGGGWSNDYEFDCKVDSRYFINAGYGDDIIGFRIVRSTGK